LRGAARGGPIPIVPISSWPCAATKTKIIMHGGSPARFAIGLCLGKQIGLQGAARPFLSRALPQPCRENYLSPDLEILEMTNPPIICEVQKNSDNYFASQRSNLDWRWELGC
jgi:hypothetical protein